MSILGRPYNSAVQPNHIQTVIAYIQRDEGKEIWKYSLYYDNPQFWSDPGVKDVVVHQGGRPMTIPEVTKTSVCVTTEKTQPVPGEIEMYNLTEDPLETKNLAHPNFATPESRIIQQKLAALLEEQCRQKRLAPSSGAVPGMPSCDLQ